MKFAIFFVLAVLPAAVAGSFSGVPNKRDVAIPNRIRLVGDRLGSGRVEVFHEGEWGSICGKDLWTLEDATVVCAELGFKKAIYETRKAKHGQGTGKVLLKDVRCTGKEHSLLECPHSGWGNVGNCGHSEDVGVTCLNEDLPEMTYKGCFVDQPTDRTMPDSYANYRGKLDWPNLRSTSEKCAKGASEKGYTYFGLQYFGECYGAPGTPDYAKNGQASPSSCPLGAGMKSLNAVYMLSPWKDLGCWTDAPGSGRTMTLLESYRGSIDWEEMDGIVPSCYEAAKAAKKKFFAIQFYGECWVSNDNSYKRHGQAINCWNGLGEHWSNYVYEIIS